MAGSFELSLGSKRKRFQSVSVAVTDSSCDHEMPPMTPEREALLRGRRQARIGLLIAGTGVIALAEYVGFRGYPSIGAT